MKCALFLLALSILAADAPTTPAPGKKAEQTSCSACHSLRLIDSQRLSTAAWTKEVTKMIGWGAVVPDRQLLIDYLSEQYSDAKPVPSPDHSTAPPR